MSARNSTPAFAVGGIGQSASQWRSVKDEMPKDWDTVLIIGMTSVSDEPGICSGYWDGGKWLSDPGYAAITDVSHWMPLSAVPGKGGRAICILEPLALAAGFLLFWGALIWAGLRWVDDGAPRPIEREVSR